MKRSQLQVYDPPMCCSSGVCGPNVNPELVRFSSDLDWLRGQGVEVERYSLSSHPGAFVKQLTVREALKNEGFDCLPLIVVNGLIVSKGIYPTRSDLMKLSQSESERANPEATPAPPADPEVVASDCGPGCNCGAPSGGRSMKVVVSVIALLAIGGIFIYKASSARQNASGNSAAKDAGAFAVAQAVPNAMPGAEVQFSEDGRKMGEHLESLSALNTVASNQDAVFILLPTPQGKMADRKTNDAVLAAQRTLKSNKITLGLYTLSTSSPDYRGISAQVQPPAILVAIKGKGISAVSGEMTETKLLQAFVACSNASCGPSGCGPAGCN